MRTTWPYLNYYSRNKKGLEQLFFRRGHPIRCKIAQGLATKSKKKKEREGEGRDGPRGKLSGPLFSAAFRLPLFENRPTNQPTSTFRKR